MIDLYEKDLPKLSEHIKGLMSPAELRAITKQGVRERLLIGDSLLPPKVPGG